MGMTLVTMAVRMGVSGVTVCMARGLPLSVAVGMAAVGTVIVNAHRFLYGTRLRPAMQPLRAAATELVGQFDTRGAVRD